MSQTNELGALVRQFFDPSSSQSRKKEIDVILTNFKLQNDSWKQSILFLKDSQDDYVQWFALSVLEETVWKSWGRLSQNERNDLRLFLLDALQKPRQRFVVNKLAKVLVDIAKHEWPNGFPELLPTIDQLTKSYDTTLLRGLVLLKTFIEEIVSSREDVSASRKDQLIQLLTQQVPGILMLVQRILETVYERTILHPLVTQTPMPSPSNFASSPAVAMGSGIRSRSASGNRGSLHGKQNFGSFILNDVDRFVHGGNLDETSMTNTVLALEILHQLFGWINLSDYVNTSLLSTLFKYASLNDDDTVRLGTLAMACINEMLSRSCVPREFEEYLTQIFRQIFAILKELTDEHPRKAGNLLEDLDESYREKFNEFINLFLSQHIQRVESSMHFPMLDFLEQLFRFTFMQPSIEAFQSCLKTWSIFLDYLLSRLDEKRRFLRGSGSVTNDADALRAAGSAVELQRYKDGLLAFLSELLKKTQFVTSGLDLKEIDDVKEDAEGQTEWDLYVNDGVEIVAKIADLYPENVLEQLFPLFLSASDGILKSHLILFGNNVSREESTHLFCYLKDLRTLLRVFGSLSTLFTNVFEPSLNTALPLVVRFLDLAAYLNEHSLFRHGPQFRKLTIQLFGTIEAYSYWISLLNASSTSQVDRQETFQQLISRTVDITVAVILNSAGNPDDELVGEMSARLLLILSKTVRARSFSSLSSIANLSSALQLLPSSSTRETHLIASSLTSVPDLALSPKLGAGRRSGSPGGGNGLFPVVRRTAVQAIINSLVLPLPNLRDADQGWSQRGSSLQSFLRPLISPLLEITQQQDFAAVYNQPQVKQKIAATLDLVVAVLESVASEGKAPKSLVHEALREVLPGTVNLLRVYVHEADIMEVTVGFFLSLFETLRGQLGEAFLAETLDVFFTVLGGDLLASMLASSNSSSLLHAEVAARFLMLLRLVVEDPSRQFDVFLNNILNLCFSPLSMLLRNHDTSAISIVRPAFVALVHSILLNKWKYFYPLPTNAEASSLRLAQFNGLLEIVAAGLQSTDIDLFQTNLRGLEKLNEVNKLYQRDIFRNQLYAFLEILLRVLLNKTHELLREDVVVAVYNMAVIDFDTFYAPFINKMLSDMSHMTPEQKMHLRQDLQSEKDLPSFTKNIDRFVSDSAFFGRLNQSVSLLTQA